MLGSKHPNIISSFGLHFWLLRWSTPASFVYCDTCSHPAVNPAACHDLCLCISMNSNRSRRTSWLCPMFVKSLLSKVTAKSPPTDDEFALEILGHLLFVQHLNKYLHITVKLKEEPMAKVQRAHPSSFTDARWFRRRIKMKEISWKWVQPPLPMVRSSESQIQYYTTIS
ncbi:hypothetical protein PROFUN_08820 [Planoprotostelium fungivorum]|uniref:Uncharacterized protein n=1 Tax=Planoprotostelium fungivorum TaxID=1890364 RepID=A0A2P6MW03_9EUKA|nr:hypothetical protein PROFUN_08820 [Planoprotostelium fungivorum]